LVIDADSVSGDADAVDADAMAMLYIVTPAFPEFRLVM
jgi:hypothetical protein